MDIYKAPDISGATPDDTSDTTLKEDVNCTRPVQVTQTYLVCSPVAHLIPHGLNGQQQLGLTIVDVACPVHDQTYPFPTTVSHMTPDVSSAPPDMFDEYAESITGF